VSPADRLIFALQDGDHDLARQIANSTRVRELRDTVINLAARVPAPPVDTEESVIQAAAEKYGVDPAHVVGDQRRIEVLRARQVSCYAMHLLGMTYSHIGRVIHRDHSTVINSVARVGEQPRLRIAAQHIATDHGWDRNRVEVV
jgi:chromosomal replication initiation ATPase DnaA